MPIISHTASTRGVDFWNSIDPENTREVLEAVNEELGKDIDHLHWMQGTSTVSSPVWVLQPCLKDCQVFLLRGRLGAPGHEPTTQNLSLYRLKDVAKIGLYGTTTIVIVEEGTE